MSDVLLIEGCNFVNFPPGGQLTFARHMLKAFGTKLALVGISTDETPVGKWIKREINGTSFDYYAYMYLKKKYSKPILPWRLIDYVALQRHRKGIMSKGIRNVFMRAQQTLLCVKDWQWNSSCYFFPGMENPLRISRYSYASVFAPVFEKVFNNALGKVDVILAAADASAIDRFVKQSKGAIKREKINQFPTRVDTSIFSPDDQIGARRNLELPLDARVFITSGRIHWAKGWNLLLDSFYLILKEIDKAFMVFVGDGEDRYRLENKVRELRLGHRIRITGHIGPKYVAKYLNAADLYVMGSQAEGWPTCIVEAIATGKPVVSTDVSGVRSMIDEGKNGYIVGSRKPEEFCKAIRKALAIKEASSHSIRKAQQYSLESMALDMARLWTPLKICTT